MGHCRKTTGVRGRHTDETGAVKHVVVVIADRAKRKGPHTVLVGTVPTGHSTNRDMREARATEVGAALPGVAEVTEGTGNTTDDHRASGGRLAATPLTLAGGSSITRSAEATDTASRHWRTVTTQYTCLRPRGMAHPRLD